MVEDWIDTLVKVWEIDDGKGQTVRSYRLFERDEFPDVVPLDRPSALSFIEDVSISYSQGGPNLAFWRGSTEFNLTPDLNRSRVPYVLKFYRRIIVAAAANLKLGGLAGIEHFILLPDSTVSGPEVLKYGDQTPHLGLVARWEVKERFTGLVVAA